MGNDRVASVNDGRVVAAFVEHTHVNTEVVCHVDSTAHTALIRADDHQMIIIDDMISSGESMLEVAKLLKDREARNIYMCSTFGLFTSGLEKFDKAYEEGLFTKVLTTNVVYQTPELLSREYYISCDLSKYIALIIDKLNHDASISGLLDPADRIQKVIKKFKNHEKI